ncbi:glycosyltransferase family 4 protein [Arsukibacterium sp.]|uniref:glycosyltransferase family 4 protein n=1 Tax=Arsukibacterium sp. TaxID=1977258 RepID=UPI001BD4C161|nr:glycosyltransferase family 4 protein [Arsukibacterium sp.]
MSVFSLPRTLVSKFKSWRNHRQQRLTRDKQLKLITRSGYFDPDWYLSVYPDVASDSHWHHNPAEHYLRFGAAENRDPGPCFSSSGYKLLQPSAAEITNPLLDAISRFSAAAVSAKNGGSGDMSQLTQFAQVSVDGVNELNADWPWLLICAHSSGPQLFGAERSLLDVLHGLKQLPWNLLVVLPSVCSKPYLQSVQDNATKVVVMPYSWWRQDKPAEPRTVALFKALMANYPFAACYCNTLVLNEPLLAAQALAIPTIVHVRELPEADKDLCRRLAASPAQIRQHMLSLADYCIANSASVAAYINAPERTTVIANAVDTDLFISCQPAQFADNQQLRIGLISSNLPKKGLADFGELARLLAAYRDRIKLCLIGPDNEYTERLKQACARGELPDIIEFAGYVPDVITALQNLHVVLNLSHFQESFGRTVLEAMAAGRAVICYDWGALTELVQHNSTGILVPFSKVETVAEAVINLYNRPQLINQFGAAGQSYVNAHYSKPQLAARLEQFFQIFQQGEKQLEP